MEITQDVIDACAHKLKASLIANYKKYSQVLFRVVVCVDTVKHLIESILLKLFFDGLFRQTPSLSIVLVGVP